MAESKRRLLVELKMAISSRKALRRGENGGTQVVEGSLYVPALYLGHTIVLAFVIVLK